VKLFDLKGKVAVVFGGTSGIGKAISIGMMEAGAEVVPISRDKVKVNEMLKEINRFQKKVIEVESDVTNKDSVKRTLESVLKVFGKVDILINSAGAHIKKNSLEITEKEWDHVIDTNLKGTFLACQVFGKQMRKQKSGNIINIASLGAHVALSEATAYCASKAGVLLLTKCLAVEWAKYKIRVNSITPGVFRTTLNEKALSLPKRMERIINNTPFHRLGQAKELVGAAIYLASEASSFVTGEDIVVDGGFLSWGI
jgi:gluconate 5-dehydrogenase/2-deoxy-D-gluconate 3-dehydrogenase